MSRMPLSTSSFQDSPNATAFTLQSGPFQISCRRFVPTNSKNVTVIYCHGMQSHQKWFSDSGDYFREKGITVYTWDRPGSGESSSEEGIRGHISSRLHFTQALRDVIQRARFDFPNNKIFLWGNSYGAKVVLALEDKSGVDGLVFSTPGLFINKRAMRLPFSLWEFLFTRKRTLLPTLIPEVEGDNGAGMFTNDSRYFEKIKNDSLSLRSFTKSFYLETAKTDMFIRKHCHNLTLPTKLLLVAGDSMMLNKKTATFFLQRFRHCELKTYGDPAIHEHYLMFSSGRAEAFKDLERFFLGT